jgi:hypothetical protein
VSGPQDNPAGPSIGEGVGIGITILLGLFLVVALLVGAAFGCKAYGRYQKRADANNQVKVTAIQIRNQQQRVKIANQQAQIRYVRSVGVRRAQDEIAKTLTPLYVKFEMIDALRQIAQSGRNSTVIYIPSDKNGMAAVPTAQVSKGK